MKKDIILCMLTGLFLCLATFPGKGQTSGQNDETRQKKISAAKEIMSSANTCALITSDSEGRARARMMEFIGPEEDFTIWFGTNPKSRKVAQIKHDPRVSIYFPVGDDSGYVMYYGLAELINDKEIKASKWKKEWEAFYPDQDESFLLIKVVPEWIEVVSYQHGLVGDSITWEPPLIYFDKD
jgi:general stress protein 26